MFSENSISLFYMPIQIIIRLLYTYETFKIINQLSEL